MIETLQQLGAVIRNRRQERELTLTQLAAATGISKPYLSNIETGRPPGPASAAKLQLLEEALDFEPGTLTEIAAWLRTPASVRALLQRKDHPTENAVPRRADGTVNLDALLSSSAAEHPGAGPVNGPKIDPEGRPSIAGALPVRPLPLINRVAAGPATEYTDLNYPTGVADAYVPVPKEITNKAPRGGGATQEADGEELSRAYFALTVTGDSMEPQYHAGDILIVGAGEVRDGDDCLVRLDEAENYATTFKRVYFMEGNSDNAADTRRLSKEEGVGTAVVRLVPLNPKYPDRMVPRERITGLFPVLWKMTSTRRDLRIP